MDVIVTTHAEKRIKERVGLSKHLSTYVAEKAIENGLKHADVSGSLKRFLDGLYLRHKNENNMRIYNHKVFLFSSNRLVTVVNLPQQFFKTVNKINSNRIKNIK